MFAPPGFFEKIMNRRAREQITGRNLILRINQQDFDNFGVRFMDVI